MSSGKNVFELLSRLPRQGIGARLSRTSWQDNSFWLVTDVKLAKDGKHGTAWGLWTWRGAPQSEQPKQVVGPLKKVWRVLEEDKQQQQPQWTSLAAEALEKEQQAAAAKAAAEAAAEVEGEQQQAADKPGQ